MKKFVLIIFLFSAVIFAQEKTEFPEIVLKLKQLADVEISYVDQPDSTYDLYEVMLLQPLNHLNPNNGEKFRQRIFWFHRNTEAPTTLVTEGYSAWATEYETTNLTQGNQLQVEHRFFGKSLPDSLNWKYLTIEQSAADHHRIYKLFSNLYSGKWISTGISKGGQTTIIYKYYYPNDMDVWVPYVAPLNFEMEDPRIHTFLENVGTTECREKVLNFQRALLEKRDEIMPLLNKHAEEKKFTFDMSPDSLYEYAVFEYSFGFWQWGNSKCIDIPLPSASAEDLFEHWYTASSFNYFDTKSKQYFAPFFYQAYTELGYYNYDTKPFEGLLHGVDTEFASSIVLGPDLDYPPFNPNAMANVYDYILEEGNNMIYIYGELDTWTATGVDIGNKTNSLKMVLKNGHHWTRIKHFSDDDRNKIYKALTEWLEWEVQEQSEEEIKK